MNRSEYAQAGVDYTRIEPFKQQMIEIGKKTLDFSKARGVKVWDDIMHTHGAVFEYQRLLFCQTQEGLGNKNWIAEWMYKNAGTGRTYYEGIGIDTVLMAANDNIAQGARPIIYTDEVAVGDDAWFQDEKRATDLANSFREGCALAGCSLPAGESPALRYLLKSEPPVSSAPSLSGCTLGIINPRKNLVTGNSLGPRDIIIGAKSSGLHANGISLVIKRALALSDQFLTKLPNGNTLGDEALIPTLSYVALIEGLQEEGVNFSALLPGTGDGIGKIAFDKRPYTYRIHSWVEVPILFQFMRELGVSLKDCLKTFNWGIGYYLFVPRYYNIHVIIDIGRKLGYDLVEIGIVEEGERKVIFEPENITLPPPGE